jgi:plasmid stabilization system protein ParE
MAGKRLTAVFTENFSENLEAIRIFLGPEGRARFERLLDRLFDDLIPTLCRFPRSGRVFLAHPIRSVEARTAIRRLKRLLRAGEDVREFILDEYLLLYLVRDARIIFLAVEHHLQLSFDLHQFWP